MFKLYLEDSVIVPKISEHLTSAVFEYNLVFNSQIRDELIRIKAQFKSEIERYGDMPQFTVKGEDDGESSDFDDGILSCLEKEKIKFKIRINKKIHNRSLNIYSVSDIVNYFESETISENISKFSSVILKNNTNLLRVLDDSIDDDVLFESSVFSVAKELTPVKGEYIDRDEILNNLMENTSNVKLLNEGLLPTDFFDKNTKLNSISSFFNSYAFLLALMFLMNSSEYVEKDRKVKFTLVSSNMYQFTYSIADLKKMSSISEVVRLYEWAYTGQTFDKLTLARQMLIVDTNSYELAINTKTVLLIKQAYRSYLRRDLDKYISSQNKLFEILNKVRSDIDNVVTDVVSGVRSSTMELIAFFLSFFFANQLTKSAVNLSWLAIFAAGLIAIGQIYSLWLQPKLVIKSISDDYQKKKKIMSSVLMDIYVSEYLPDDLIRQEEKKVRNQLWAARGVGIIELLIAVVLIYVMHQGNLGEMHNVIKLIV